MYLNVQECPHGVMGGGGDDFAVIHSCLVSGEPNAASIEAFWRHLKHDAMDAVRMLLLVRHVCSRGQYFSPFLYFLTRCAESKVLRYRFTRERPAAVPTSRGAQTTAAATPSAAAAAAAAAICWRAANVRGSTPTLQSDGTGMCLQHRTVWTHSFHQPGLC